MTDPGVNVADSDDSSARFKYLIGVWGVSVFLMVLYIPLGIFPGIQQIIDTILGLIPNITLLQVAVAYLMGKEIYESLQARDVGQLASGAAGGLANIGGRVGSDIKNLFADEKDERARFKEILSDVDALKDRGEISEESADRARTMLSHLIGDAGEVEQELKDISSPTQDEVAEHMVEVALSEASKGTPQQEIVGELNRQRDEFLNDGGNLDDFKSHVDNAQLKLVSMSEDLKEAEQYAQDEEETVEKLSEALSKVQGLGESELNEELNQAIGLVIKDSEEMAEYEKDLTKIARVAEKAIDAVADHKQNSDSLSGTN